MQCPKCQYKRKPTDDAPAWQCPSCKVAYNKVPQASQSKPTQIEKNAPSLSDAAEDVSVLSPLEILALIAIVLGTIPWMMYSMNTLLPAMGVERIRLKALIVLGLAPSAILIGLFLKLKPFRGGELSKVRKIIFVMIILTIWLTIKSFMKTDDERRKDTQEYWDSQTDLMAQACHGGKLDNEGMNNAYEMGYRVNTGLRCIDKKSYEKVEAEKKQYGEQQAKQNAEYNKLHAAEDARIKQTQVLQMEEQIRYAQAKEAREQNEQNKLPRLPEGYYYRCTAADGSGFNNFKREPCPEGYRQTMEENVKPVMPRSPNNTSAVKCTAKDGQKSIQIGNCASPDDIQQAL